MKDSPIGNTSIEKRQSMYGADLSALRLSKWEILLATLAGIATWISFRNILRATLPYPCSAILDGELLPCGWTYEESWTSYGDSLFSSFSIPIVIILALSAVFLLRAMRGDERYFSTIGNLAFAWPLISFPLLNLLTFYGFYCLPMGVLIAFIGWLAPPNRKRNLGDWIALVFSVAWFLLGYIYFIQYWNSYGD